MAIEESKTLERYFDKIAPNYQFMNSVLSLNLDRHWRNSLLKQSRLKSGDRVLDIACGPGDILEVLGESARQQGFEFQSVGLDLSFGMLKQGAAQLPDANLIRGNGIQTPFKEDSFDLITIAFGFRNMPDYRVFIKEALRILSPGGRLIILELTQPKNPLLKFGNTIYLRSILPLVSSLFGRDREAYDYLQRSIEAFPPQDEVTSMMRKEGYKDSNHILLNFGITTLFIGDK